MNLVNIADKLEGLGLGVQGVSVFINHFPAQATPGILLRERLVGAQINHDLPGYIKFSFQAIVRASNYSTAELLANQVALGLKIQNQTMGTWKVNYIRPQSIPVPFRLSIGEIIEYNIDFDACVVDSVWE